MLPQRFLNSAMSNLNFDIYQVHLYYIFLKILDYINVISNPDQSEIVQYIRVTLKTNTTKPQLKKQSSMQDEKSSRELTPQSVSAINNQHV